MALWGAVAVLAGGACASAAAADAPALELYGGETVAQAASIITPWGGGSVSDTDQANFIDGKRSLLFTTIGPYQGVAFTLKSPLEVGDVRTDKTHYLTIAIAFSPAGPPAPVVVPKPKPKNSLPDQIGSAPASLFHLASVQLAQVQMPNMPGGMPGMQGAPQPAPDNGAQQPAAPVAPAAPLLNYLRAVITTPSGTTSECIRAVPTPLQNAIWITMGFPLSNFALSAQDAAHLSISRVVIAGDTTAKAYLGYVRLTTDSKPFAAVIQGDTDLTPSVPGNYMFFLDSGSSNVKWDWTIDDGSPAEHGVTLTHQFAKPGVYHVGLTVTDIDGIKAPFTTSIKVVVQEQ